MKGHGGPGEGWGEGSTSEVGLGLKGSVFSLKLQYLCFIMPIVLYLLVHHMYTPNMDFIYITSWANDYACY